MPIVAVTVRNFVGAYASLNGEQQITVSRREILHAVLTLGFQNFSDLKSAPFREWLRRIAKGISALSVMSRDGKQLKLDGSFVNLDMSEKGAESYSLGMIFAKIVAGRLLDIPWLAHVDKLRSRGELQTSDVSDERGDMVGLCSKRRWHVVEAKGRSNPFAASLVTDAKHQAASVTNISGETPATNSACITSLWSNPIRVLLDDPPADGETGWDIPQEIFWLHYYKNISAYVAQFEEPVESKMKDRVYAFAKLASILEVFPDQLQQALSPLPAYIGLPRKIIANPSAGWDPRDELRETSLPNTLDGLVLIGPFSSPEEKIEILN
jgi:hypothetical protein